jgi:hypothetical protein
MLTWTQPRRAAAGPANLEELLPREPIYFPSSDKASRKWLVDILLISCFIQAPYIIARYFHNPRVKATEISRFQQCQNVHGMRHNT